MPQPRDIWRWAWRHQSAGLTAGLVVGALDAWWAIGRVGAGPLSSDGAVATVLLACVLSVAAGYALIGVAAPGLAAMPRPITSRLALGST